MQKKALRSVLTQPRARTEISEDNVVTVNVPVQPKIEPPPPQPSLILWESPSFVYNKSACICIVLNQDLKFLESMASELQNFRSHLSKTFIVFVTNNASQETVDVFKGVPSSVFMTVPQPTETKCRNVYLDFVTQNVNLFDLMIVMDPIIVLKTHFPSSSLNCLNNLTTAEWDVMFANQSYKYYDVESLITSTCNLKTVPEESRKIMKASNQQHIPVDSGLIEVKSAFGGLGIYNTKILATPSYYKNDGHVSFNLGIANNGYKMYIHPEIVIETHPTNAFLYV